MEPSHNCVFVCACACACAFVCACVARVCACVQGCLIFSMKVCAPLIGSFLMVFRVERKF